MRPRLLDLFCGAGLAAEGYIRAGFDVVGVDLEDQPRYPGRFIQGDVLMMKKIRGFDAVHASPPCQFGSAMRHAPNAKAHDNLIPATRRLLQASGLPYVIENVEQVRPHLVEPIMLCGSMFGLAAGGHQLRRHRLFETSFPVVEKTCRHKSPVIGVYGGHVRNRAAGHGGRGTADFVGHDKKALALEAMGLARELTMDEISQGIPPAFTAYIGEHLQVHLRQARAAA